MLSLLSPDRRRFIKEDRISHEWAKDFLSHVRLVKELVLRHVKLIDHSWIVDDEDSLWESEV